MPVAAIEGQSPLPRYEIEEDSTLFKALSCVPVLGVVPSLIQYSRLYDKTEKLVKTDLPYSAQLSRFIELTKVEYDYLKANSVNGLLCVAIAVSLLYFGVFTGLAFFPLLPFGLVFSTVNLYGCYSFKSDIKCFQQIQVALRIL